MSPSSAAEADFAPERPATTRVATVIGAGTVGAHISQLVWLALGARTMGLSTFGAVLAAQALYAVLQTLLDIGPAQLGARRAARGAVDDAVRGALTRTRLTIAFPAAAVALGFAVTGHGPTALAVLPFAVALPLFGLLNVWERFGRGDGAPWAAYLFLRSAGPALAAGICFIFSVRFPPFLAGTVECASILAVMAIYRLRPLQLARLARTNDREPFRAVAGIGAISILFQLTTASGTVLLSASGANDAAAVLGVGLRLTTGLNSLLGVLSLAMFARLARTSGDTTATARDAWATGIVLQAVVAVAAAAATITIVLAQPLLALLVGHPTPVGEVSMILVLAALPAAASSVALATVFVARRAERSILAPFVVGAGATLALGAVALAAGAGNPAWMAGAMLVGQLAIVLGVAARVRGSFPELSRAARTAAADGVVVAACAAAGAAGTGALRLAAAVPIVVLCLARGRGPLRALHARLR